MSDSDQVQDAVTDEPGEPFGLFVPITKVDELKKEVWGLATIEEADNAGEVMDYDTSKPHFQGWSQDANKRSGGKSFGNVRSMHNNVAAGKLIYLGFDDARKAIPVGAKITNPDEWNQVVEGVYTGFSVGGKYVKRWYDNGLMRYTAKPTELSLVDAPCVPDAVFQLVKMDGKTEDRHFKKVLPGSPTPTPMAVEEIKAQRDVQTFSPVTINVNMSLPSTSSLMEAGNPRQAIIDDLPAVASPATDKSPDRGKPNDAAYKADSGDELYTFPIEGKQLAKLLASYNKGLGKDKFEKSEWLTIGRRIAVACDEQLGKKHTFNASTNQIISEEKPED